MTNINYKETDDYNIAFDKLIDLVASVNKSGARSLVSELLTESEQIMIVKRFAAILLFHNDYSSYRVSTCLNISLSTAQRIHKHYDQQAYHELLSHIKPKERNRFYKLINDLILAQASPRARARLSNRVR